jgi:hypothetical protein
MGEKKKKKEGNGVHHYDRPMDSHDPLNSRQQWGICQCPHSTFTPRPREEILQLPSFFLSPNKKNNVAMSTT